MTLGEKIKAIRKRLGLSQEQLAELVNVSRQAITKWENDGGLPDISNLQELSKLFGISVDYFINNQNELPTLVMRKKLDKEKYGEKLNRYDSLLKELYPDPWKIFILSKDPKMGKLESILDLFTGGDYWLIKSVSDLSPYYLVMKDNVKLLINIKDMILEVKELPFDTNMKKFVVGQNRFRNCGKVNFKK